VDYWIHDNGTIATVNPDGTKGGQRIPYHADNLQCFTIKGCG
jgi:hypothetical protein